MNTILIHQRAAHVLSPTQRSGFRALSTSLVSDVLERDAGLIGLHRIGGPAGVTVGNALTVRTREGDNLAIHLALDLAQPGDVLVVDGHGSVTNALIGGLMVAYAAQRQLAAIVVDGAVRDRSELADLPVPVYARAVTSRGPYKSGPGSIHGAVCAGGVVVNDGDVIVADEDGVAAVPWERADRALVEARAKQVAEQHDLTAIRADCWDRSWVRAAARTIDIAR